MKIIGGIVVLVAVLIIVGQSRSWAGPLTNNQQTAMIARGDGLVIKDIVAGTGRAAKFGDMLVVNYAGTLTNGVQFDSSYARREPFRFQLGAGQVIKGWEEGFEGMKIGGKRELTIPPEMGYGPNAVGPIPPNSVLKFTVELVDIANE